VAVNLVRALSRVYTEKMYQVCWERTMIGRSKQKKRRPPAPYTAITGYGTVNRTPPLCAQITSPINRTRNVTWRDTQAMFVDAHNVQLREPAWNCARQSRLSYAWPKWHWQNEYFITYLNMLSISLNLSLYFLSEIDTLRFRDKDLSDIGTPE
jgi:hypothetical protein